MSNATPPPPAPRAAAPRRQMSGVSGPANAGPGAPRTDPIAAASAGGPSRAELRAAWSAYQGAFTGPLTPLDGQPNLNVLANRCGPIVRTGVDFLFGPVLKLSHSDSNAQDILDAAWGDDDRRMTTLSKSRINGGVYGHVFAKIVTPRNKKPMSATNPPRIVVQNPELYSVETDPDDCDLVTRYVCTWQGTDADGNACQMRQTTTRIDPDDGADETGANATGDDEGPDMTWQIQNWVKSGDEAATGDADWAPQGEPIVWPYPFAPIVDWQNYPNPNDHWGARDIDEAIVNLNQQLHLVESNTNSVNYSQGHPRLFNVGDGDTAGATFTPGTITDIPGGNIVAVSASGDIAAGMAFAEQIRSNMDEGSATPGVATGRMAELPKGAISGITLRLLYGPRLMRTEHERRLYGGGIRALCRAVLILCGQETAAQDEVTLTWSDPLPQDDLAMAQMALALQQLGLSDHTIYAMLGKDYDTEQEYKKQEAQDAMKAAMQGGALPVVGTPPPPPPAEGQQQQPANQQPGQPGQQHMPDPNHPAAVAQRNATAAVAKMIKGAQ